MSLDDALKNEIRGLLKKVKAATPDYQVRPAQHQMIAAVANTLARIGDPDQKAILVCEAGTGTGKTNGYLIPALPIARALKKKIVISSATIALQEQIVNRDLPAIASIYDKNLTYAMVKGRGRYACRNRLELAAGMAPLDAAAEDGLWDEPPSAEDLELLRDMASKLRKGTWSGDRDEYADPIPERLWVQARNDHHACIGRSCPNMGTCAFYVARGKAKTADVLVANHDLVLANLRAEQGSILGDPADCIYIADEAHHLAPKGIEQFAAEHHVLAPKRWLRRLAATATREAEQFEDADLGRNVAEHATNLERSLDTLAHLLEQLPSFAKASHADVADGAVHQFRNGTLPDPVAEAGRSVAGFAKSLFEATIHLHEQLLENAQGKPESATRQLMLSQLGLALSRIETISNVWTLMLMDRPANVPPVAKWVELVARKGKIEFVVSASPVSAAKVLSRLVFDRFAAVIMTSATLTALGNFDLFNMRTGLGAYRGVDYLQLRANFDYANQAQLVVPQLKSNPKDADEHTRELVSMLPDLIDSTSGVGTLVLFSSKKQMQEVLRGMPAALQPMILAQDETPKAQILHVHAARIKQGWSSVIFGLASFGEGVDLPGALCQHVIIAKLPFAPPDNPVDRALADWIESRGGRPFDQVTVPEASVKLIQNAGRLLRRETDTGKITILDKRIATTSYGKKMLNALPPFSQSIFGKAA